MTAVPGQPAQARSRGPEATAADAVIRPTVPAQRPNPSPPRPSLWRNRNFLVLWSGQIVSTLGSGISGTAMPLLVLALTGSPADAGLVGAAGTLPFLLISVPAGPLVDRWNRRRIMRVAEFVAGLALVSVPIAAGLGLLSIMHLVIVAAVQGACTVFFGLAERAALPKIVPPSLLAVAVAQNEAKSRGAGLVGPPLGGLLFGVGRAVPFIADAVSYLMSSVSLLFLRGDLQHEPVGPPDSLWRQAATGVRWIWRNPLVRAALILAAVSNMVFQALTLTLVVLAQRHGARPAEIGLMFGVYSGGGFLGALAAARLHAHLPPRLVIIGIYWIWSLFLLPLAFTARPLLLGSVCAASAFFGPLWNVIINTLATVLVPNELLGRVMSAGMAITAGVTPLAAAAAGFLLTVVGPVDTVWVLTGVMFATAVAASANPSLRRWNPPG